MVENKNILRAYLALAAICIIWGTTYTVTKIALVDIPPYLIVAGRQIGGGIILIAYGLISGVWKPISRKYFFLQTLIGLATITGGNGFIAMGLKYVSSGLSAVIGSLTPVAVVVINLFWANNKDKLNSLMIVGVLVGFAGLGLIFQHGWADFLNPDYRLGILACFGSCITWALGTVMSKQFNDSAVSSIQNAAIQITMGGLGALIICFFTDTDFNINPSLSGWLSMAYLAVIGSAFAFSIYMFALKYLSATVSSLYTYINPTVAIILGAIFLNEKITWTEGVGMMVTLVGVYLVNLGQRRVGNS